MKNKFITATAFLATGELQELQSFGVEFKQARGLPGNVPVLTCHITEEQKHFLGPQIGKGNLGFGYIPLEDGVNVQMIRIQLGDLQFCWIAEMDDPDLWAAIDMWMSVGRLPVLFKIQDEKAWDYVLIAFTTPPGPLPNEAFRTDANLGPSETTMAQLLLLVASGTLQEEATTDIPGISVRHVFVNVLMTEWTRRFIEQPLMVGPGTRK
ncbi:hypothetical protein BJN34_22080 [Cupriavidus necator]|uniref:Uncharacterized protein n=1 Tax=Cupriavidus necator TaxID=106590 RepID=A0A1U9UV32_CUPNE|nr:hypothetical protein [Cupriavidus necator]AQV96558.1 hypothetical protein BJN34_22080 [Cupriavidus necator]